MRLCSTLCFCVTLAAWGVFAGVGRAATMELEWTLPDGRVTREVRPLVEKDGVAVFSLPRAEIVAKGAKELALTPDFARARKGDDGFWVFSSGECGTFRCDEGRAQCDRWQLMSVYGMQTPERTFAAIVHKLKYYFTTRVTAKGGEYRMSCVLGPELCRAPYEDFEIEFRRLDGAEATMGGIARAYRRDQLKRGAITPLKERAATNAVLREAIEAPEIRIRQAWKPVPPKVLEQTPEAEPPVTPHVTFDRVTDIARALKGAGIGKVELCLVGWNIGGHDGRWPQAFPAEPTLGGDEGLRRCVKAVRDMGYLIVPHGNYLDAYRIAESWDEEWLAKTADGGLPKGSGSWGGGMSSRICPQRAYERFCSRDMWRMGAYGFKGLGYFDVVSIVPADACHDPRHPVNRAEAAKWWGKGAALSRKIFGGFASEGAFDHFASELDYALYVSFKDPRKKNQGLVDRMAPFPQLVYNGVFAMNPFTRTVNFTAQEKFWQLKLIEFGGRPSFYFYSKFKDDGKNWMGDGDLGCATDAELAASVAKIKEGADIYAQLSRLQFEFMEEHDSPAEDVWRTTYSDGTRVYVNYGKKAMVVDGVTVPPEGWICAGSERIEAWSSEWIEVTAANGVKDDYYPLQKEPEKCSFRFRVMRHADNTIGVEAFVRDDKIVVDNSPAGSISCPTWKDDCLEVFFDGDNDRNPNTRGPDWNDNPTPCNAGGEYAMAANGATQSDYASAKKCFGSLWGGFAQPWTENGARIGTHYRLWFTWECLNRPAPPSGESVPVRMTVCIHDDDDGGACDYALYWKGNPKYPFADESAFGEIVLGPATGTAAKTLADCRLSIQFDNVDLRELGCDELLRRARLSGADGIQIERCDFYLDGDRRVKELERLGREIGFFEKAGYPVALWITSLGYGRMEDKDFLRRFPKFRPLRSIEGGEAAVCTTDVAWRDAVADNVRDFIRAGAKTILFDDDLVQACRPGICCACEEHRRRIAARLGVASVTPEQLRDAYAGAPNALRTACLDVMGESLMDFCRAMRAAADEVDPSVMLATCLSISQFDLDGVDVPEMVRVLAGKGTGRPFVRLSGATYWTRHPGNARNWGQGLGGVIEYLRWQAALLRAEGFVPLDENDPYPRDVGVVPEGMCEAYDRAMIAEGGIVRNKYVIRHNVKKNNGIAPEYLAAHLAGRGEAERIETLFRGASPIGFEVFAPPHLVREATLPPYKGKNPLLKFFAQPQAGILLAANGAPTRYDSDSGAPLAVFGPAAAKLPEAWLKRGVLTDRDGAEELRKRGIDTGLDAKEGGRTVEGWRFCENAKGEKFAVAEKGWYDLDGREASPTPVPVREIWRFFTGEEIPVCLEGARGVHLMAKRRPDGTLAVLVNNMRGETVGPFTACFPGASRTMALDAYGCRILQVDSAGK